MLILLYGSEFSVAPQNETNEIQAEEINFYCKEWVLVKFI